MLNKIQLYTEIDCPDCEGTGTILVPYKHKFVNEQCEKCTGEGYVIRKNGQVTFKEFKRMLGEV